MDRQIVYPGAIPLETDLLNTNKYAMIGLAKLAAALLGANTYVHGLACTASSPASMVINVAAGQIYSLQNIDGTAYSSLAADTTHTILKQGLVLDATQLTLTAPGTSGYSVNYLIQVAYTDTDSGATVLPYYNASNPSVAWSGPNNSGTAQNTIRSGVCTVALKAGVAATTGTQTTPSPDSGYTGLYVITVAQGATTVTSANISVYPNAPILNQSGIYDCFQRNSAIYGTDTGVANAYVVNVNPGMLSLTAGTEVIFRATNANTTSSTLNVSALGAFPIISKSGATLIANEIVANSLVKVRWSAVASSWILLDATGTFQTGPTPAASSNSTQLATTAFVRNMAPGQTGSVVNLSGYLSSAAASATFTADEAIVSSALGGLQYRLANLSLTINVSTTGAGGMDTGSVPASGYVGIYLIYNPTTSTAALLGVNATSAAAPLVYGGSNMPSGYSASALISVIRTSSSLMQPFIQRDKVIATQQVTILSTSTPTTTVTALSITAGAPLNSKYVVMGMNVSNTSSGSATGFVVYSDASGIGAQGQLSSINSGTLNNGMMTKVYLSSSSPGIIAYNMNNTNAGTFSLKTVEYGI